MIPADLPTKEQLIDLMQSIGSRAKAAPTVDDLLPVIQDFQKVLFFTRSLDEEFWEVVEALRNTVGQAMLNELKVKSTAPVLTIPKEEPVTEINTEVAKTEIQFWQCRKCKFVQENSEKCAKCGSTSFKLTDQKEIVFKPNSAQTSTEKHEEMKSVLAEELAKDPNAGCVITSEEIASCDNPECGVDQLVFSLPAVTKLVQARVDYVCSKCKHRGGFMASKVELAEFRAKGRVIDFDFDGGDPSAAYSYPVVATTAPKRRGRPAAAKEKAAPEQSPTDKEEDRQTPDSKTSTLTVPTTTGTLTAQDQVATPATVVHLVPTAERVPATSVQMTPAPVPPPAPAKSSIELNALVDKMLAGPAASGADPQAVYEALLSNMKSWPDDKLANEFMRLFGSAATIPDRQGMLTAVAGKLTLPQPFQQPQVVPA
jgi:Zn finger protein HypA/HybF involved in hydrogenase expression